MKEQKEEIATRRDKYFEKSDQTNKKIRGLRDEISKLESELIDSVPSINGAQFQHFGYRGCVLKTVYRIGHDNEVGDPVYYCAYCDRDFQITESNNIG